MKPNYVLVRMTSLIFAYPLQSNIILVTFDLMWSCHWRLVFTIRHDF